MKLKDIMTRDVAIAHPHDSLRDAAHKMRVRDIGFLPVFEGSELLGVVTDRVLIFRATAEASACPKRPGG